MFKLTLLTLITLTLFISSFAQKGKNTVPIKWERYKISEKEISILMPKMPVFYRTSSFCDEKESNFYAVYADDAVYQLKIISKSKVAIPDTCNEKIEFGKEPFEKRLQAIRVLSDEGSEKKYKQNEKEVVEFTEKLTTHWIFNDLENNKWVEISITNRGDTKSDTKRYRESLKFDKKPTGKEIGAGSLVTLGDEISANEDAKLSTDKDANMIVVSKIPPNYTDAARRENVTGDVKLRVTFLADGSIGAVSPVNSLPFGLTEQAIAAAKKLTFLPARKNGKKISVAKLVQYSFKIY